MSELKTTESNPMNLIEKAVSNGGSIDQLEKLMDLQERWEKKEAEKDFHDALNKFQSEKPSIIKSKKGHNSKYAPLPKIQKAIDPVLTKFGLSYRFEQSGENGKIKITCILSHSNGHSKSTHLEAGSDTSGSKNAIQAIGSTISYLKRYTLENALGLSADEDDDGQTAPDISNLKHYTAFMRLTFLMISKKESLKPEHLTRVEDILMNEEKESYSKAIKTLKEL